VSEELGLTVCRLSLDAGRGRIRHPHQAGIAIRAAVFVDLACDGRIAGMQWPEIVGEPPPAGTLAAAVYGAVAQRRRTGWRRWFNHTTADREAATRSLIAAGQWQQDGRRVLDTDQSQLVAGQLRVSQRLSAGQPPEGLTDCVLSLLAGGAGLGGNRPVPRAARKLAKTWLPPLTAGNGNVGVTVQAVVDAALLAMRRASSVPFSTG